MKCICPNCNYHFDNTEKINKARRICSSCNQPIKKHDKWMFRLDGKIQHKDCSNPTQYLADKTVDPQKKIEYGSK